MKKLYLTLSLLFLIAFSHSQTRYLRYVDSAGYDQISTVKMPMVAMTGQFSHLMNRPSTMSGYGITDGMTTAMMMPWNKITGVPTTLAGFGILDAYTQAQVNSLIPASTTNLTEGTNLYWTNARGDARYPLLTGTYPKPSWITSLSFSKITGTPTSLSGYGILDPVVLSNGSYSNPTWITSLSYSKLTGTPTIPTVPTAVSAFTNDVPYASASNTMYNVLSKAVNYTIQSTDFNAFLKVVDLYVDASSGNITVTASTATNGYVFFVTKTDATANTITVSGVNGSNVLYLQGQSKEYHAGNSGWWNH